MVPFEPTHHLKNSDTVLDLCIIDDSSKLIEFDKHSVAFLSAHILIHINYDIKLERTQCRSIICRNFKQYNDEDFLSDLQA